MLNAAVKEQSLPSSRVLIVDDEVRICELVSEVADDLGYDYQICNQFEEFPKAYSQYCPDVVVLDLMMPGGDGLELLEFLKEEKSTAQIVLLSGVESKVLKSASMLAQSHNLRFLKGLRKPLSLDDLEDTLSEAQQLIMPLTPERLEDAIANQEIEVYYQPKVNLSAGVPGEITAFEALARWNHPVRGLIGPFHFIPMAEEHGLIGALTTNILDQVCAQIESWKEADFAPSIAVNFSPELLTDTDCVSALLDQIKKCDAPDSQIIFEVTETGMMQDSAETIKAYTKICLAGLSLSIDDFGTGSSSLVKLYRLPFSEMKIDRSFVMAMDHDEDAANIVRAIIGLAKNLNMTTCAEGVETQEVARKLAAMGCDVAQGFYFSKPVPADHALNLLKRQEFTTDFL